MKAIVVIVVFSTAGFFSSLPSGLPQISEPIGDFSDVPVKNMSALASLSGFQDKPLSTYIPISRASAERSSIVGVEVCLYSSFKASS